MTKYQTLLQQLFQVNLFNGMKLGLTNALRMRALLNFPDLSFPVIHVAGTNGKGSVVTKIAAVLQEAGYRVGRFISPHISSFRERITINDVMISEEKVEEGLSRLFELIKLNDIPATFFEITTFLALDFFRNEKVDFAVLETGLGGRLDATNIVDPFVSVITSIDLDHQDVLGKTIEEITMEKAGIIKHGKPVVIGPRVSYPLIQEYAQARSSKVIQVKEEFLPFHLENQSIAKAVVELLKKEFSISNRAMEVGLKREQPCRFEIFDKNGVCFILDVAHNPNGLTRLFERINQVFPGRSIELVFGLSKNKDLSACFDVIQGRCSTIHLIESENGRGFPIGELYEKAVEVFQNTKVTAYSSIINALQEAAHLAGQKQGAVVVCGSFFIMGEVRRFLGLHEPSDGLDMNEVLLSSNKMAK